MSFIDQIAPFLIGGISGTVATLVVQPIDAFKVLIQLVSERIGIEGKPTKGIRFLQTFTKIQQSQGFSAFYRGLDSAVLRQIVYGSARLGSYNSMLDMCERRHIEVNNWSRVLLSMMSGVLGALVGTPFDIALVRRQASLLTPQTKPYKNTLDAFYRIVKGEGLLALWKGLDITILRVVTINVGQLASHDIIKVQLKKLVFLQQHSKFQSVCSALAASFLTSLLSLPADNIKVKIQKSLKGDNTYTGIVDCFKKTVARQGVLRLWVGFPMYLMRGMPHSFILITTQDYLRTLYKKISH